ncbi:MAG: hypothetical protein ACYDAQ_09705 [Mycobacteriales bacterium]
MHIGEFYEADTRRRESVEEPFGDGWTTSADPHATYRASYVVATAEVYTVREPHHGGLLARYLDELHLDSPDLEELQVEIFTPVADLAALERLLDGWREQMTTPDSLSWLRDRVRTSG